MKGAGDRAELSFGMMPKEWLCNGSNVATEDNHLQSEYFQKYNNKSFPMRKAQ